MILPVILGQAPSRLGDGRPFTGPSGDRLVQWAGVESRDELLKYFRLDNLLPEPLPHHPERRKPNGNLKTVNFSRRRGREQAVQFIARQNDYLIAENAGKVVKLDVVVLGKKVWESLELNMETPIFGRVVKVGLRMRFHRFPHPSGLNHQMNDPKFLGETSERLRRIGHIIASDAEADAS